MTNAMLTNASHHSEGKSALAWMTNPGEHEGRQFGRRIESDRQWTVYHVFTGVPAVVGGHRLAGLSRAAATASMLQLNLSSATGHGQRS
jgi:hypothetical protein